MSVRHGGHYSDHGDRMHGEYTVRVHLAGDGAVFCSLEDEDGESLFPGNIEYIEISLAHHETDVFGQHVFEDVLTPEGDREGPAPVVGKAVYQDGILEDLEWDMSEVDPDGS